ncbi:MAG: tetratricopeptide repeat protein, partial [Bacteroidota bacterium]
MSVWILGVSGVLAQADLTNAIANIRAEKFSDAQTELQGFLGAKQKNTDQIYYWLGYIAYQQEAYDRAKTQFEQSVGAKSKSPFGNAGLAVIALKEDKLADAKEYFDNAVAFNKGKDIEADFAIAEAYLEGGSSEIQQAKVILYGTRDKAPDNPQSYILLGEYYKKQGVIELAIEELEKAISKAPDYVPAYVYLAELYYEQGKETKNAEDFNKGFGYAQQAIKKNPEYAPAYRIRGELYLLLKEYQKARDDLKKYVSLAGNDRRARIRYASFLFLAEDYEQALKELNSIDTTTNVMRRLKGIAY